jgi:hypothetical protein
VEDVNSAPVATDDYTDDEFPSLPANGYESEAYTVGDLVARFFKDWDDDRLGIAILAASDSDSLGRWEYSTDGASSWQALPIGQDLGVDLPGYDPANLDMSYRGRLDSVAALNMLMCK